jgi:coenzyme F420-0:L-glutamate ligase/coenzyme F420-1:gamma-L-glutamate ligase
MLLPGGAIAKRQVPRPRYLRLLVCASCEILRPSRVRFLLPSMANKFSRPRKPKRASAVSAPIWFSVVPGLPEIRKGHNLAKLTAFAARRAEIAFEDGDILVVAQKVISKAEGRTVRLSTISPSSRAIALAKKLSNDSRFIEVVLRESRRVVRSDRVLIVETHHGFVCANAGVDHSNVRGRDFVTLLPKNPDRSARRLAAALRTQTSKRVAVVISDTFGRPWRLGLINVAIGAYGVPALVDLRGTRDRHRKLLRATVLAVADELAAAAGLLMDKSAGNPIVVIRGYRHRFANDPAARIIRPASEDLFR